MLAIYHIPGATVAADALRAACAGLVCCLVLAVAGREGARGGMRAPQERWVLSGVVECAVFATLAAAAWHLALGRQALLTLNPLVTLGVGGVALVCASSLGTALWEEVLFRHLAPHALATQLQDRPQPALTAALACSLVFGVAHAGGLGGGSALLPLARLLQTTLFGLVMAGVATRRRGLAWAVALHAAYDLVAFGCTAALAGVDGATLATMPATALISLAASPAGIAVSLAFLLPLATWSYKALSQEPRNPAY